MKNITYSNEKLRTMRLHAREALLRAGCSPHFKPESSAKWSDITKSPNGNILVQIEHDNIKGVTPEMLKWWFENLGRSTTWNGKDFSGPEIKLYHLWHHRDHVAVTPLSNAPDGSINYGFLEGADSRIEEYFNEFNDHIFQKMHTTKLDEHEFTFEIKSFGMTFGRISHYYDQTEDGCSFYAETEIGCEIPIIGVIFNWLVLPFLYNKNSAKYWIRHNIEETGRTEDILPVIYANRDKVK